MAPSAVNILEDYSFDASSTKLHPANGSPTHYPSNGHALSKQLISQALKQRIKTIDQDICEPGEEDTFFVADLGDVYRQHLRWKMNLPRVKPHYGELFSIQLTNNS